MLGALAVGWGIVAESRVLLFDGVYVLLGILLSWLSLVASSAASAAPTRMFPFGKQAATPLVIAVQGAALLGTLLYAGFDAITLIRAGGSDVAPETVLAYGVISATCSLLVSLWLGRRASSDILAAEVAQWRAGALLSGVIAVGGAVALVLDGTSWSAAVAYADPVLVLLACVLLAPLPVRLLRSAALELLEAAPPAPVQAAIATAIADVRSRFGLPEPTVAATKLGRRLYVDVVFVVAGAWEVAVEDDVRRALIAPLSALGHEVWANVELTLDAELAE